MLERLRVGLLRPIEDRADGVIERLMLGLGLGVVERVTDGVLEGENDWL